MARAPDLRRGVEPRGDRRGDPARCGLEPGADRRRHSPDGTGEIADRLAAAQQQIRCCTGRARRASARPTSPDSAGRSQPAPAWCGDGRRLLPRPRRPAAPAGGASDADLVIGSRYVPGGGVSRLGRGCGRRSAAAAARTRAPSLGIGPGPDRRLQVLPPRGPRGDRPRLDLRLRLRLPGRDDLPGDRAGFRVVEVPIVFRDRRAGGSKMGADDRRRGGAQGPPAAASARPPLGRRGPDPHRRPSGSGIVWILRIPRRRAAFSTCAWFISRFEVAGVGAGGHHHLPEPEFGFAEAGAKSAAVGPSVERAAPSRSPRRTGAGRRASPSRR